jgi:DNA-binding NarL/FixJ family response regulator
MEEETRINIRILLLGNESAFIEGLAVRLNKEKDFTASVDTGDSAPAVSLIQRHSPDVLIYDISDDAPKGFPLLKKLKSEFDKRISVITFSDLRARPIIKRFLDAGGSGYLLKGCPFDEFAGAIRSAVRGGKYVCPELAGELLAAGPGMDFNPDDQNTYNRYTSQRKNAVRLLAEGLSNQEIAAKLGIESSTAAYHRKWIMHDFNVHCATDLYIKLKTIDLD